MALRYLRRPPKSSGRFTAAAKAVRGASPANAAKTSELAAPAVTGEERDVLAKSLAYFCVACGREYPDGEVRACDIADAATQIETAIYRRHS